MSNIAWTDETWNPVIGCTPVSPGCLNCYAARMARRQEAMGTPGYEPREIAAVTGTPYDSWTPAKTIRVAEVRGGRPVFTGEVRVMPDRLTIPMRWRTPRRVFVNSMSDLFHEAVPFKFIDHVFTVMAITPRHTYQVLTKRPERMAEYLTDATLPGRIYRVLSDWLDQGEQGFLGRSWDEAHNVAGWRTNGDPTEPEWNMPLLNLWLGTSVENQAAVDERILHLLRCQAAVLFLSMEPLLEDLGAIRGLLEQGIGWGIIGCESGPGARGHNEYAERAASIIDQCRSSCVPVFHKQMPIRVGNRWRVSHDPAEWPKPLQVREWPEAMA
jgi:protein gp37